jgi:hypothetical protein
MENKKQMLPLRITVPKSAVEEFTTFAPQHPDAFDIESVKDVTETSYLKWGLGDVANIVALVDGAILIGKFAVFLHGVIFKRQLRKVVLTCPKGSVSLTYDKDLKVADVVRVLTGLLKQNSDDTPPLS